MNRMPDYERGRFFISPILGCNAQCSFCYIYDKGYKSKISKNDFSIDDTLLYLKEHSDFREGKGGSIISIGAWGDPFPRYNVKACYFSLHWLIKLAELENPIQIMSRYELHQDIINGIVLNNLYEGQILYSTSLSSINNFRCIEPYSDSPESRLQSLSALKKRGIATNVMIKPFISGVTDIEIDAFVDIFKQYDIKNCVVGDLLLDDTIKNKLNALERKDLLVTTDDIGQVLDCTSGESYEVSTTDSMLSFASILGGFDIKVFRKSSCVNSFILNTINPAGYMQSDPNGYCIQCGVCN